MSRLVWCLGALVGCSLLWSCSDDAVFDGTTEIDQYIGQVVALDLAQYGFARTVGGFAVVVGAVDLFVQPQTVGVADMARGVMNFSDFFQALLDLLFGIDRNGVAKVLAAFDFVEAFRHILKRAVCVAGRHQLRLRCTAQRVSTRNRPVRHRKYTMSRVSNSPRLMPR